MIFPEKKEDIILRIILTPGLFNFFFGMICLPMQYLQQLASPSCLVLICWAARDTQKTEVSSRLQILYRNSPLTGGGSLHKDGLRYMGKHVA